MDHFRDFANQNNEIIWKAARTSLSSKLMINDACQLVKDYFEALPQNNYTINNIMFLNEHNVIEANFYNITTSVGFKLGYICFATDSSGDPYVFDAETGEIMLVTREGVTQDSITDLETLEELSVSRENFRRGVFEFEIYEDIIAFQKGELFN